MSRATFTMPRLLVLCITIFLKNLHEAQLTLHMEIALYYYDRSRKSKPY